MVGAENKFYCSNQGSIIQLVTVQQGTKGSLATVSKLTESNKSAHSLTKAELFGLDLRVSNSAVRLSYQTLLTAYSAARHDTYFIWPLANSDIFISNDWINR